MIKQMVNEKNARCYCLHLNGLEQIEGVLLSCVRRGDDLEGGGIVLRPRNTSHIAHDTAQQVDQRLKAVNRGAVFQDFGVCFLFCRFRALCRGDRGRGGFSASRSSSQKSKGRHASRIYHST